MINLAFAEDQESRGTPREAGGPQTKGKVRIAAVRSLSMVDISDMYCGCLTSERRELIS